jgi:formate--tetrahydrofolate ligase
MASIPSQDLESQTRKISDIASDIGLLPIEVEPFGFQKAKVTMSAYQRLANKPMGKLVLVTSINPTPAGEGKTTTTIGLADALQKLGYKSMVCLRQPSMGPVFGIKGGATGGGKSTVFPQDDINLHFTGDMHAVTAAHNLLAAVIDNHLHHGNELRFDPTRITIRRILDMNDRTLRHIVTGLGGSKNGHPRETGFDITASSEIMAILCLSENYKQLKERLSNIIVGYNTQGMEIFVRDLHVHKAMAVVLRDALKPNLVQTSYGTPAFIHGGPFANIAHGCNSLVATKLALRLSEVVVTEAGFATDLGAEKFFNIKCRVGNLEPDVAVIVATAKALKLHGGMAKGDLDKEGLEELARGFENLAKHIENIRFFGVPCVVAINKFPNDHTSELTWLKEAVAQTGVPVALSEVFENGAEGGVNLASQVTNLFSAKKKFDFLYPLEMPLAEKLNVIARCCYGADGIEFSKTAREQLALYEKMGYRKLPICVAKTQYSLSDNPALLARPQNFRIFIREARLAAGAGFVIAVAGEIMTMPGLPKAPSLQKLDIDDSGTIFGLS